MKINILKEYVFYPDGNNKEVLEPGEHDIEKQFAEHAISIGHAEEMKSEAGTKGKK